MRTTITLGVAVATLAAVTAPAGAQGLSCNALPGTSCFVSHDVDANAPVIAKLSQERQSSSMPPLTVDDFDTAAGVNAPPLQLEVVANVNWVVSIATATSTWDTSNNTDKPSEDLRMFNGIDLVPLSTFAQTFAAGEAGTADLATQFNSLWSLENDPPGIYRIEVIFTLSTP